MKMPIVLVYEQDGVLAEMLRGSKGASRWSLHEPRRQAACLELLARSRPGVFILKLGGDLAHELTILEQVAWYYPDAFKVVVGEQANLPLTGLAWDLGADLVLSPPLPRHLLPEVVERFLTEQESSV